MTPVSCIYKVSIFLGFFLAYWVFYLYPNFFARREAHFLPLLQIDLNTPLLPASFLIYLSDYLVFAIVILIHQTRNEFNHLSRMCFLTLLICGSFFLFYPTIYPRPPYPSVDNPVIQLAMNAIQNLDSPKNCFPSLHVALTGVATYSLRTRARPLFLSFVVWTLLIYLSTLTTKQHYFVDILGGIFVVIVVVLIEEKVMSKQRWILSNTS